MQLVNVIISSLIRQWEQNAPLISRNIPAIAKYGTGPVKMNQLQVGIASYKISLVALYRKHQKLSRRKVLRIDRICENVEKTFAILLP